MWDIQNQQHCERAKWKDTVALLLAPPPVPVPPPRIRREQYERTNIESSFLYTTAPPIVTRPSLVSRSLFRYCVSRRFHPAVRIHKETWVPSDPDTPPLAVDDEQNHRITTAHNDDGGEPGIPPPPPECTLPRRPKKNRRCRPGNCLHRPVLGRLPYDSLSSIEL